MENYSKGANIEQPLDLTDVPIKDIPSDVVWMKVKPASKMTNLIGFALKSLEEKKIQLWTGVGPAMGKTISCVEIIKRRLGNVHQISKISYTKCEELWEPKLDGLDTLKVVRNIPVIHILLSTDPLETTELGYQAPGAVGCFGEDTDGKRGSNKRKRNNGRSVSKNLLRN